MDTDNFLAHYGVKGMKWGVRRKPSRKVTGAAKGNRIGTRNYDARKMNNSDLKRVVARMELEQKYSSLNKPSPNSASNFIRQFIQQNGTKIATGLVLTGASAGIGAALTNAGYSHSARDFRARLAPRKK